MKNKKKIAIVMIVACVLGYFLYYFIKISNDKKMQNWCVDQLIQMASNNIDINSDVQDQCNKYRVMRDGGDVRHHPLYIKLDGNSWITDFTRN